MKSHEVLKKVVEGVGTKQVAYDMRVSSSLVYKWCADPGVDSKREASGTRNPLDRILHLVEATGDPQPVIWLCEQIGGHFVESTDVPDEELDAECIRHTQVLLEKFTNLLQVISGSIANESRIDEDEAREIRSSWQALQRQAETFVRGCEHGTFDPTR
jgi:hypothetical protein